MRDEMASPLTCCSAVLIEELVVVVVVTYKKRWHPTAQDIQRCANNHRQQFSCSCNTEHTNCQMTLEKGEKESKSPANGQLALSH